MVFGSIMLEFHTNILYVGVKSLFVMENTHTHTHTHTHTFDRILSFTQGQGRYIYEVQPW